MPFLAALVPVAAGVVLWLVSGSLYALCFAALGPLMLVASLIDGTRVRRRARRLAREDEDDAWRRAEAELVRRHGDEREARWRRYPDAARCLAEVPLHGPESVTADTMLVLGSGDRPSVVRSTGGGGERARAFMQRCAVLTAGPVTVPLARGVCVRGPRVLVLAVARALALQLSLRFGPAQLALVGSGAERMAIGPLAPARSPRHGVFRIAVVEPGDPRSDADAVIHCLGIGGEVPEGITTVLDVIEPRCAELKKRDGTVRIVAEGLSSAQAAIIAASRADGTEESSTLPGAVDLADLTQHPSDEGLPAVLGIGETGEMLLDIVNDGPHAIVTGTTGTGKSELLVSWVAALASVHGPERVSFVLADFKGGTSFDALAELPQVAAVITDLDEQGAHRGVKSLTAELRRRETVLAAAGARDVSGTTLPRLVIVVDEFAALLQEHPDLGEVFVDIAARGRALGMHLVLGTQRAAGVIRDSLAANCPLRVSLRVSDPADSRQVIGTDAAAELPGGAQSRGLALVRRPHDVDPVPMRVAMTGAGDLDRVGLRWAGAGAAVSPWLPALAASVELDTLLRGAPENTIVLGVADVPERQQQPLEVLRPGRDRGLAVIGSPGSGRTMVLRTVAAQAPDALWMPCDPEGAWDAVRDLVEGRRPAPAVILCDDIDARLAEFPADYAQQFAQSWEQVLRSATDTSIVLTAARVSGGVGRLFDALPVRALLRTSSRIEHLAAGGEAQGYTRDRMPGRAAFGEREVQFARTDRGRGAASGAGPGTGTAGEIEVPEWSPRGPLTALVTTGPHVTARRVGEAYPGCRVLLAPQEPDESATTILVGDADTWQRNWGLWQRVRTHGEILIRAENPGDLRQLAGVRDLPPYAQTHRGRLWSLRGTDAPERVRISALAASARSRTAP